MPKEVIQYGDPYVMIQYNESEDTSAFWTSVAVPRDIPEELTTPEAIAQHYAPGIGVGDRSDLTRKPNLEVYWHRADTFGELRRIDEDEEGSVQVLLDLDRAEVLELARRMESDPEMTATAAITGKLSRYQINKLIKTLRRARNAAYGDDE